MWEKTHRGMACPLAHSPHASKSLAGPQSGVVQGFILVPPGVPGTHLASTCLSHLPYCLTGCALARSWTGSRRAVAKPQQLLTVLLVSCQGPRGARPSWKCTRLGITPFSCSRYTAITRFYLEHFGYFIQQSRTDQTVHLLRHTHSLIREQQ